MTIVVMDKVNNNSSSSNNVTVEIKNSKSQHISKLEKFDSQNSINSIDYRTTFLSKLSRKTLFYLIIPAIPVFLLFICFLLLIDTKTFPSQNPSHSNSSPSHASSPSTLTTTPKKVPLIPRDTPEPPKKPSKKDPRKLAPATQPLYRLPTNLLPSMYILNLHIFLPYRPGVDFGELNKTIAASVIINFFCQNDTDVITLHQNGLLIDENSLKLGNQDKKEQLKVSLTGSNNMTQIIELTSNKMLKKGSNYTLYAKYAARINHAADGGIFIAGYEINNETRYHATSQMQPVDARRVFPCFDEPFYKAIFQINIVHPAGTRAISNTEVQKTGILRNGWVKTEFEMTPVMSTYILAMAVTDFGYIEDKYRDITLRVYASADVLEYCKYSLHIMSKALSFFESYFNITYPLSKLDLYGVPELRVQAMENWGLITIKNDILLHDSTFSATSDKYRTQMTIFHEVAHTWFGNLVTMTWWNDVWLNEGFACHLSRLAMYNVSNNHLEVDQYHYIGTTGALSKDEPQILPPLSPKLIDDQSMRNVFSHVTYFKGESVIQMIEQVTGKKFFQQTLQHFVKNHQYGNAVSNDLSNALNQALQVYDHNNPFDDMDVGQVMTTWTKQRGFPTILVNTVNDSAISIKQACFHIAHEYKFVPDAVWVIPVFYRDDFESTETKMVWLKDNRTVLLPKLAIIDPEAMGYYRVLYDKRHYQKIIHVLNTNRNLLPEMGRIKIINDAFILQRYGLLTTEPFDIALHVQNDNLEQSITFIASYLQKFASFLENDDNFKKYEIHIYSPIFDRLLAMDTQEFHEPAIKMLIMRLCMNGHQRCRNYVNTQFEKLKTDCKNGLLSSSCNRLSPGIRPGVYAMALKYGNDQDFQFLWDKYLLEKNYIEQDRILQGLAGTTVEAKIEKLLNYLMYNISATDMAVSDYWLHVFTADNLAALRTHLEKTFPKFLSRWPTTMDTRLQTRISQSAVNRMLHALYRMPPSEKRNELWSIYDKSLTPQLKFIRQQWIAPINKDFHFLVKNKAIFQQYFKSVAEKLSK